MAWALLAAAVAVPLVRQAGQPWNSLWAEDGAIYVGDANTMPLHETLFRGYAGYGQLLCRLLALPTRYVPLPWVPHYVGLVGALTGALLAAFVYRAARAHVPSLGARLALAGTCVLLPLLAFENEANVVNLTWILTFTTFWALVSHEDGRTDVVARSVVAFLGPASTPIAAGFLPVVPAVLWARRRRADAVACGSYLVGLLLQVAMVLATDDSVRSMPSSLHDLVTLYPVRVVASAVVGETAVQVLWRFSGPWLGVALTGAAAVMTAMAVRSLGLRRCGTVLAALALSFPLFAVPVFLRGSLGMRMVEGYNANGARYAVVPALLLVSAGAVLCGQARWRWVPVVFAGWVLLVGLSSLGPADHWRPRGPSWSAGLRQAQVACRETAQVQGAIPVAPKGWYAPLPCERIVGAAPSG